ncbi:unnamed protein product, partial [Rotaria sp. Silwood1]
MVYLLEKNEDNHLVEDSPHHVMKILKENKYSKCFQKEVQMSKRLKRFNNLNKFHLFFQAILYLLSSESLSLIQSKQVIDIIHYLYDCLVIHRDSNHIKLIDFVFAFVFNMDNKGDSIEIIGPLTYASEPFLDLYLELLSDRGFPYYFYERTFDLICVLNIIMAMSNVDIER